MSDSTVGLMKTCLLIFTLLLPVSIKRNKEYVYIMSSLAQSPPRTPMHKDFVMNSIHLIPSIVYNILVLSVCVTDYE